jgi:hypothetical protein
MNRHDSDTSAGPEGTGLEDRLRTWARREAVDDQGFSAALMMRLPRRKSLPEASPGQTDEPMAWQWYACSVFGALALWAAQQAADSGDVKPVLATGLALAWTFWSTRRIWLR